MCYPYKTNDIELPTGRSRPPTLDVRRWILELHRSSSWGGASLSATVSCWYFGARSLPHTDSFLCLPLSAPADSEARPGIQRSQLHKQSACRADAPSRLPHSVCVLSEVIARGALLARLRLRGVVRGILHRRREMFRLLREWL